MMNTKRITAYLLCLLLISGGARASDHEDTVPYYRSIAFNAPILAGWANQSSADYAQFELAAAQATIRTAIITADDGLAAAQGELGDLLGVGIGQPLYNDKVNLADGTWHVFVFDIDDTTTASVMARRTDRGFAVISFVERNPAARTMMVTVTQADDAADVADPEIGQAALALAGSDLVEFGAPEVIDLASGAWRVFRSPELVAVGMVFGNDSYIALQTGEPGDLAALADAWNRALLGFFITPDNSRFLALGLAATFVILGALIFSFSWRSRNLRQELALIQQLARAGD